MSKKIHIIFAVVAGTVLFSMPARTHAQSRLWKSIENRRDEFLSKTPQERRFLKQQVRQKMRATPQRAVIPLITPVSPKAKAKSLLEMLWGLFKKQ